MKKNPYSIEYWFNFFKGVSNLESSDNPIIIPIGKKKSGSHKWMMYENLKHNMFLFGTYCSGKTTFLQTVMWTIENINNPKQIKVVLVDPRFLTFTFKKEIPFLYCPIVNDLDEYFNALKQLLDEIEKRKAVVGPQTFDDYYKQHKEEIPYILMLIDDYYELASEYRLEERMLQTILKEGKKVGIFVILSTLVLQDDYPISKKTIDLFDNKICMFTYDKDVMRYMVGRYQELEGNGDMIIKYPDGSNLPKDVKCNRMRLQGLYLNKEKWRKYT